MNDDFMQKEAVRMVRENSSKLDILANIFMLLRNHDNRLLALEDRLTKLETQHDQEAQKEKP